MRRRVRSLTGRVDGERALGAHHPRDGLALGAARGRRRTDPRTVASSHARPRQSEPPAPEESSAEEDPRATDPSAPCSRSSTPGDCVAREGCLWDGSCRPPHDPCETIRPDPSWSGEPVFDRGDPCQNVRADCAWSVARRRCVPFVAVPACPPSLSDAQAAEVLCNHAGQAPLDCRYGDTHCHCVTPGYCGGAPPPPPIDHPPATFTCVPPVDAQGCPTTAIRDRSRCNVLPDIQCMTCRTLSRCVRGRWRVQVLPPRP
jgi:hypothetical protein